MKRNENKKKEGKKMADFLPSVTVEEFTSIVKRHFEHKMTRPIFGLGKGGIGKTESIADLARELEIGYQDIRLLLYSESDLKGIPYVNAEHTHTIWLQNDILPRVERDGERGILVLDEVTSCAKSVRTAAYQLLNERRLGEYSLPEGWMIVCLGNGEEDGGQFNGMEGNFANRCSVFEVVANVSAWKSWAIGRQIHPLVVAYVTWQPQHLHTYDPDKEEEFVFASPRSWSAVSEILDKFGFDEDDFLTLAQIYGNVGRVVGSSFVAFCKLKEQSGYVDLILSGEEVEEIFSQEVLLMTISGVVYQLKDALERSSEDFSAPRLQDEGLVSQLVYSIGWMMSLKKVEHQMMGVKDLMSVHKEKMTNLLMREDFMERCPTLLEFVAEHEELLVN